MATVKTSKPNPLQAAAQWTVDQVLNALTTIETNARAEKARISTNNGRLVGMNADAAKLKDSGQRATALAAVKQRVTQQQNVIRAYRTWGERFAKAAANAKTWLAQHGIQHSTGTLSDLGFVQLAVPIAIGAGLAAATIGLAYVQSLNNPQTKAIDLDRKALDAYLRGQLTSDQYVQAVKATAAAAKAAKPKGPDPLGLTGLSEALLPLGLVAVALVAIPLFTRRRAEVTA